MKGLGCGLLIHFVTSKYALGMSQRAGTWHGRAIGARARLHKLSCVYNATIIDVVGRELEERLLKGIVFSWDLPIITLTTRQNSEWLVNAETASYSMPATRL
jgi:hypothetical protein